MRVRAGVASDCGHVRPANEDSFLLRPGLYAVCDGMGGARAGEVASQMACLGLLGVDPSSAAREDLRLAIVGANTAIVQRSAAEDELLGMGTTLTAALIKDGGLVLAHVGDSRAYLLHEGSLTQVTSDHSWVGEMMRRGELTPAQAAVHPHRSVITRALGTDGEVEPDVTEMPLAGGDRILLCSDGLTGMVSDEAIAEIMQRGEDPQATAELLVAAALENGGEDNVTVVVVELGADDRESEKDEDSSWADQRILIGPSDREAAAVSSHRARWAGASVRERLGRRPGAVARPGGARAAAEAAAAAESSEDEEPKAAVVPPPTGESRKDSPRAKNGRRPWWRRKWFYWLVAIILVIALAIGVFAWFNSTVYYVGTNDGKVALYRGLPWEFLGIDLSSVFEQGTVDFSSLSPYMQTRVNSYDLINKEKGQQFLHSLGAER
jgi:serine/threonine protein phosphatase PrpC